MKFCISGQILAYADKLSNDSYVNIVAEPLWIESMATIQLVLSLK